MANLTAAEIKTILLTAVYPEDVEINAALMQNEERRKYPSIDVQNVTGDEQIKGYPLTNLGQTFLVHLFYRYRSFGEQHEPDIKALEDVIFDTLDNDSNFSTDLKVTVTQSWDRKSETFPVHRSHSILTVNSIEISGTDPAGGATPGDQIDITLPGIGTQKVIAIPIDEFGIAKDFALEDTAEQIFTKIYELGALSVEMALTPADEVTLKDEVVKGDDATVTLDLNGTARSMIVNMTNQSASSTRETMRTTILTMNVKEWT